MNWGYVTFVSTNSYTMANLIKINTLLALKLESNYFPLSFEFARFKLALPKVEISTQF